MIIMCPHCAGLNRVANEKLNKAASCGKCKNNLFTGTPIEMTGQQFLRALEKTDQPLVVDFWAPWCGPCQSFAPTFAKAVAEFEPKAKFIKINTENEQQIAAQFNIRSIPTLAIFQQGKEVTRLSGAMDYNGLSQWLNQNLPAI